MVRRCREKAIEEDEDVNAHYWARVLTRRESHGAPTWIISNSRCMAYSSICEALGATIMLSPTKYVRWVSEHPHVPIYPLLTVLEDWWGSASEEREASSEGQNEKCDKQTRGDTLTEGDDLGNISQMGRKRKRGDQDCNQTIERLLLSRFEITPEYIRSLLAG
tara:strand:+ start:183 stop:671 length:489 start_codon:yes stop_codon:yes gene_type:complete